MPLLPSTELTRKMKITHDGRTDSGPLVADEKGIGVDVKDTHREGFKRVGSIRRYYIFSWDDVTGYDIAPAAQSDLFGSNIAAYDVVLTIKTTTSQHSFVLKGRTESLVRNMLSPYLARVDARDSARNDPIPSASRPGSFVADELLKLAQLRASGILTAEEFDAQKAKLLG